MNARDLMSGDVATVAPGTPLREVAKTLVRHGISAVPVVDDGGTLIGMVSEGDLVGRKKTDRESRSEWWLQRLAEGEPLAGDFLDHLQSPLAVAREVMSSPVITVDEDTRLDEIASLMAEHRIKRLPVLREESIVGIVRRADLLRVIGGGLTAPVPRPPEPRSSSTSWLDRQVDETRPTAKPIAPVPGPCDEPPTVDDFQNLVALHKQRLDDERAQNRAEAAAQRLRDLRRLAQTHVTDKEWNALISRAREAAERGETEFLLLRFPSQLCIDDGRAINAPDPGWPASLRGEAAELYLRWERDLRPRRFHITERVLEFPRGVPGDIGLFLSWAK